LEKLRLEITIDRIGQTPRATPCGLARLPNIYLQERYQVSQPKGPHSGYAGLPQTIKIMTHVVGVSDEVSCLDKVY